MIFEGRGKPVEFPGEKTLRARTNSATHDAIESRDQMNQTWATLVSGECSNHSTIPAPPDCVFHKKKSSTLFQGPEHPNPGSRYNARGFPRTCFLPDNQKGNKVIYKNVQFCLPILVLVAEDSNPKKSPIAFFKLKKKVFALPYHFNIYLSTTLGLQLWYCYYYFVFSCCIQALKL